MKKLVYTDKQDHPESSNPALSPSVFICHFLPNVQGKAEILCEKESRAVKDCKNDSLVCS